MRRFRLAAPDFLPAVLCAAVLAAACQDSKPAAPPPAGPTLTYVGSQTCATCHAAQHAEWQTSDHHEAMQVANSSTVKADFGGSRFTYNAVTSSFTRQADRFMVRTDGPDGALTDYPVAYTFGVQPLQQFLIALPGGRFQALSVAWDTRPRAEGGQRWFHLYPGEKVDSRDVLHWTGPAQNWNYMCSECHSTNVTKGYRADRNTYETTWSEINVSCESCHGPGSAHVAWAAGKPRGTASQGLAFSMKDANAGTWAVPVGEFIAKRTRPLSSRSEVETCARCHARRAQIWADYRFGQPIGDTHRVATIDEELYEANGLPREEVYEYGSFLQSKMYGAGVTCSDCHSPHSGRLKFQGNALCTQCHVPAKYDAPSHVRHKAGAATACVSCHMPERTYMVVDGRRDHGFKIPRPDESVKYGTSNACSGCHANRPPEWAAKAVAGWFGEAAAGRPSFTPALFAGRAGWPEAGDMLSRVAVDPTMSPIVRATAVGLMRAQNTRDFGPMVERAAVDPDPLVRRSAAGAATGIEPAAASRILGFLLADPVRSVRFEALQAATQAGGRPTDPAAQARFDQVAEEFRASQRFNGDRAEAHLTLGGFELEMGRFPEAESEYLTAIRLQPQFAPSYVNLADLLRQRGRDEEAERLLKDALTRVPALGHPSLQHALGLTLIRLRRHAEAVVHLRLAAEAAPEDARFGFVYAVALHDTGQTAEARRALEEAARWHPANPSILNTLVTYSKEAGDRAAALKWAERLAAVLPGNADVARQLAELRAKP